jgi:excisionase family DNA binding protein
MAAEPLHVHRLPEPPARAVTLAPAPSSAPIVPPLLVTTAQAAQALSVGVRTVERMLADGRLHAVKIGRSTRIAVSELSACVERLRQEGDP